MRASLVGLCLMVLFNFPSLLSASDKTVTPLSLQSPADSYLVSLGYAIPSAFDVVIDYYAYTSCGKVKAAYQSIATLESFMKSDAYNRLYEIKIKGTAVNYTAALNALCKEVGSNAAVESHTEKVWYWTLADYYEAHVLCGKSSVGGIDAAKLDGLVDNNDFLVLFGLRSLGRDAAYKDKLKTIRNICSSQLLSPPNATIYPPNSEIKLSDNQALAIHTFVSLQFDGNNRFQFKGKDVNPCDTSMIRNMKRYIVVPKNMFIHKGLPSFLNVVREDWDNNYKRACRQIIPRLHNVAPIIRFAQGEKKSVDVVIDTLYPATENTHAVLKKDTMVVAFEPDGGDRLKYLGNRPPDWRKSISMDGITVTDVPSADKISTITYPIGIQATKARCWVNAKVSVIHGTVNGEDIVLEPQEMRCLDKTGAATAYKVRGLVVWKDKNRNDLNGLFSRKGTPNHSEVVVIIDRREIVDAGYYLK